MRKNILFLHPGAKDVNGVRNLLKIDERKLGLEFAIDEVNPDYVIASEYIYYDESYLKHFYELQKKHPVNIFFAGEAISADLNLFDYAIVFDKHLACEDRIGRIPLIDFFSLKEAILCGEKIYKDSVKNKFCCFIYSNPNAHQRRDELFYLMDSYKHVDSLGGHLNNTECTSNRYSADWKKDSVLIKSEYKFSIAAENAMYRGYTSEKIMTSFLAGSIPIYWGNPLIAEEFNEAAFINANGLTDEELLDVIRRIDEDDSYYRYMIDQPWMSDSQIENYKTERDNYASFISNIFTQEPKGAYRRGIGTAPALYENFMKKKYSEKKPKSIFGRILVK